MKKRAVKTGLIALEVAAVLLAIAAASIALLFWRLEQGSITLSLFKPSAEFAIARNLPAGHHAEIGNLSLGRGPDGRHLALAISDLDIRGPDGARAASAPIITLTFASADLLRGEFGPRRVDAEGGSIRVVRNDQQNVQIDAFSGRRQTLLKKITDPLTSGRIVKSAFESASLTKTTIEFFDVASGRSWVTNDARVEIKQTQAGLNAIIDGAIAMDETTALINAEVTYEEDSGVISAIIEGEAVPLGDLLAMFYGEEAAILNAPVSGKASIAFTAGGDVLSSRLNARVGAGEIKIAGALAPVEFIKWEAAFDPATNKFNIDRFEFDVNGSSGVVSGGVTVDFDGGVQAPSRISFDLKGESAVVNLPGFLPEPLPVNAIAVAGAYDIGERRLHARVFEAELMDIRILGNIGFHLPAAADGAPPPSIGVNANLTVEGALSPGRLLRLWPLGAASGARDWVKDRLETAIVDNIVATVDLPSGAVREDGLMPDDAMKVTFNVHDAKAYYVSTMTPLTGASGAGVLRGNSFTLKADKGRIGNVALSRGEVEFPVFIPKWQPTYIRFTAHGRSDDILGILDEKPLFLLEKITLSPEQFKGDASARIEIMRPNKRDVAPEEYRYSGKATFENMLITGLVGDIDLAGAKGEVDLRARSLTVTADASLSEAPINIVWRQNFFKEDGPSTISVAGTIDSSTGDLFGVSSRQYLRGPVAFTAKVIGELGAAEKLDLKVDLTKASLAIPALGWEKPENTSATGDIAISFANSGVTIDRMALAGDGLAIAGSLAFGESGMLISADLKRFYLGGAADLALTAARNATGALQVTAVGDYLNAAPMVERALKGSAGGDGGGGASDGAMNWGPGLVVNARIDRIGMREGVGHRDAALDLWRDANRLQSLTYTALDHDGPPLSATMALTGLEDGPRRAIEARSGRIGALLAGVFGLTSIDGGEGVMVINLGDPGEKGFTGVLEARDLRVVEAPLLARIFAAGSLTGLAGLLNDGGIELDAAYGQFSYRDGVISITEARATGPSLGITVEGETAFGREGEIALSGAIAPLYQINSILGAAPIIGDILVGKQGEGILALSYQLSGETAAPAVSVNPLSVLTPGIFRNIFQPSRASGQNQAGPARANVEQPAAPDAIENQP